MRKAILLLLASLSAQASGNLCLSATTTNSGTWSSPSTWTNCGNSIPGDGDWVVWRSSGTLTIDMNVGTSAEGINWIRQELGTVTVNPGVTITFNSTGTNFVGSGTNATNSFSPGADATMQGFFLAKGTAFNLVGTPTSRITVTSANGTSPVYISHAGGAWIGCTAITANVCNGSAAFNPNPAINISYADFPAALGTADSFTNYTGIALCTGCASNSTTTTIQYSRFWNPYITLGGILPAQTIIFAHNTIYYPVYQYQVYLSTTNTGGRTVTDNTMFVGTNANKVIYSSSLVYATAGGRNMDLERNAVYNANPSHGGYVSVLFSTPGTDATGGNIVADNFDASVEPNFTCGTGGECSYSGIAWASGDTTSVYKNEVAYGMYCDSLGNGFATSANLSLTVTGMWRSQWKEQGTGAGSGQGCWITHGDSAAGYTAVYTLRNNVCLAENSSSTLFPMAFLGYSNVLNTTSTLVDHNTMLAPYGGGQGIQIGEANPGSTVNSSIRSNIVSGFSQYSGAQIEGGNPTGGSSTFISGGCVWGGGVCNNLSYGAGPLGQYYKGTAATNFDNGTTAHPSSIYGDLTANPRFVDTTRRPCGFGVLLGLDGSCPTFFAALATRALGTNGCTVCGTFTDGAYGASGDNVIEAMRKWLFHGALPQNPQAWCGGHDGETVGAVPFCKQGHAMIAATAF